MAYYTVELVRALAWPAAVIVLVFLMRPELRGLLSRVEKAGVGPAWVEFNRTLQEAQEKAERYRRPQAELAPPSLEERRPGGISREEVVATLASLAARQPAAAILAQWQAVELLLDRLMQTRNVQPRRDPLIALQHADVIDHQAEEILKAMRKLRNRVAHTMPSEFAPTATQAEAYVEVGSVLASYLTEQMLPPAKLTPTGSGTTLNGRGALERAGDRVTGRFEVSYDELDATTEDQAQAALPGDSQAVFEGELNGDRIKATVHVARTETDARDRKHVAVITVTGPISLQS